MNSSEMEPLLYLFRSLTSIFPVISFAHNELVVRFVA
jgi:hypothetical protein